MVFLKGTNVIEQEWYAGDIRLSWANLDFQSPLVELKFLHLLERIILVIVIDRPEWLNDYTLELECRYLCNHGFMTLMGEGGLFKLCVQIGYSLPFTNCLLLFCVVQSIAFSVGMLADWHFFTPQVLVMTPQILLHNLRHCFIRMDLIVLLIFDECHHAQAQTRHPYAQIMKVFVQKSK